MNYDAQVTEGIAIGDSIYDKEGAGMAAASARRSRQQYCNITYYTITLRYAILYYIMIHYVI